MYDHKNVNPLNAICFIRSASARGRAIISLLAFSGLRPESLGNYDGSDALSIKEIEGLKISNEGDRFLSVPGDAEGETV